MKSKNYVFAFLALCSVFLVGYFAYPLAQKESTVHPSLFVFNNASKENIVVTEPTPDETVPQTFAVAGIARGGWYFEASFPIEVIDGQGMILASAVAKAQEEWMTESFVPFIAEIQIPGTYHGPVTIVLKKDNPSGMPENDGSVSYTVRIE